MMGVQTHETAGSGFQTQPRPAADEMYTVRLQC